MMETGAMLSVFLAVGMLIALTILVALYRAALGPGVFNRVVAINVIGTKTVVLLVLIGYYFERPLFFDLSLLYALLNFIGTLIFAKYLERGEIWSASLR
jgi:multicomponent Na+:H+ antiporter subunit F